MSVLKQRFLLVSDMHYTTDESPAELAKSYPEAKASVASGNCFGKTQRQKIEKIYADILAENKQSPLDAVLVLGDLSIDDYDYRKLPINYCKQFKKDLMDKLPCPSYALPGNHDSYPNELWQSVMGCDRRYSFEIGDVAFIMDDSFADVPADFKNPASGSKLTPADPRFLKNCLEKHRGKKIFYCSHYIDPTREGQSFSEECVKLLQECEELIFLYRGHTHVNSVQYLAQDPESKPILDIGGYGYSGQFVNGRYDFNIFDPSWAWGYHILEIYDNKIKTYHVRTANQYVATNGTFSIEQTIEDEITLAIK